jgi:hypothetical protein
MHPEIQAYLERINDVRGQMRALLESLSAHDLPEVLNWRPIEGDDDHATNSLGVLAVHTAGAEHFWIGEVIGGMPPTRDRDAEFRSEILDVREIVKQLDVVGVETRNVMEWLTPANLEETRFARGKVIPVRWIILHIIDHSALHLGHMQLTYQLWMRGRAAKSH